MAEGTREEAKQRRAEGREKRRSMLTEPFEGLDDATAGEGSSGSVDVRETLKRAAVTGVAAAAVGALAGAAKALLDRRSENDDQPDDADEEPEGRAEPEPAEEDEQEVPEGRAEPADEDDEPEGRAEPAEEDDEEEPEGRAEPADDQQEDEESQGRAEPAEEEEDEPQGRTAPAEEDDEDEPEGRAEPADEVEEDDEPQGRAEGDDEEQDADPQQGQADLEDAASADSDPRDIVPKAREELERLLGREVESVSGFERRDGHWSVMLEVVEMRRIPDSSDVLASYEVTLDDDGRLAQMTRRRRYHRSEVEVG